MSHYIYYIPKCDWCRFLTDDCRCLMNHEWSFMLDEDKECKDRDFKAPDPARCNGGLGWARR